MPEEQKLTLLQCLSVSKTHCFTVTDQMARACERCGKIQKDLGAFMRHENACKKRPPRPPRAFPDHQNTRQVSGNCSGRGLRLRHRPQVSRVLTFQEVTGRPAGTPVTSINRTESNSEDGTRIIQDSLLKSSFDPFQEVTGRSAGTRVKSIDHMESSSEESNSRDGIGSIQPPSFKSSFDRFFPTWVDSSGICKEDVDNLLRDARADPLKRLLSFENGNEWHRKVESLL
jgi:hypothetical protein